MLMSPKDFKAIEQNMNKFRAEHVNLGVTNNVILSPEYLLRSEKNS